MRILEPLLDLPVKTRFLFILFTVCFHLIESDLSEIEFRHRSKPIRSIRFSLEIFYKNQIQYFLGSSAAFRSSREDLSKFD